MSDIVIRRYFGDIAQEYSEVLKNRCIRISENDYISTKNVYFMDQIHSNNVVVIDDVVASLPSAGNENEHWIIPQCDGLVTSLKNTFLAIKTADCFPVLIYDNVRNIVAAAHSGRDGTKQKIIENIITIMIERFSSKPKDIKVEIGVGICAKHYPVSSDIVADFKKAFPRKEVTEFLDLQNLIVDTALENNILEANISTSTGCSFESGNHFSFRRDENAKRQISLIGMVYV
jgi:hypothetical protein